MSEGARLGQDSLRLDKLLWFLRFAPTRAVAQHQIATGHIRLNSRRVERSAQAIRPGDVLTLPTVACVRVIEIVALPHRRGPAPEAQACYLALDAIARLAIAPDQTAQTSGEPPQ